MSAPHKPLVLAPEDRREIHGAAAKQAVGAAAFAALGWLTTWFLVPEGQPLWSGPVFVAVIFVGVFAWQRRVLLQRLAAMRDAAPPPSQPSPTHRKTKRN